MVRPGPATSLRHASLPLTYHPVPDTAWPAVPTRHLEQCMGGRERACRGLAVAI